MEKQTKMWSTALLHCPLPKELKQQLPPRGQMQTGSYGSPHAPRPSAVSTPGTVASSPYQRARRFRWLQSLEKLEEWSITSLSIGNNDVWGVKSERHLHRSGLCVLPQGRHTSPGSPKSGGGFPAFLEGLPRGQKASKFQPGLRCTCAD